MTTRRLVAASFIILGLVTVGVLYQVKIARRLPDYQVYRVTAERALQAAPLYRPDDGHWQFKYLPAFAILVAPLALIPDPIARVCWFALSFVVLTFVLRTCATVLPDRRYSRQFLIWSTVVLLGKFYAHEFELGQVNILMLAMVVFAVAQLQKGRETAAGALIAAAVVLKPYAVLLVPWLVARRRLPALAGAAIGIAVALLLPITLYGVDGNTRLLTEWWRTVTETTAPNLADLNNVSAASVAFRWLGPGTPSKVLAAVMVLTLLVVAAAVFLMRTGVRAPEPLEVGLLLTLMPIISPQGWDYVFLLSTLATMLLVNYRAGLPGLWKPLVTAALLVIAFTIFDVVGRAAYLRFMSLSMITLCYFVVIAGLVVLRARRVA